MDISHIDEQYIEQMDYAPEKEIRKIQKAISKSIRKRSTELEEAGVKDYHNKARAEANKVYGKGWREELESKKIFDKPLKMYYY